MKRVDPSSLLEHFSLLSDPRMEGKRRHKLEDIVTIAVTAMLCGADEWTAMEEFGRAKEAWLRQFLELPNGIPSHDTFGRVFALLDTEAFQSCFVAWTRSLVGDIEGVIAIDGKTLRRSHERGAGRGAIHMVSAFARENGMVLGQVKTEEKSNEITAIPKLLSALNVKGCTVTIDAMGCQKAIAKQIVRQGGDYLLAVKGNQEKLYDGVLRLFEEAEAVDFKGYEADVYETTEKGHGREETRRYMVLPTAERLPESKRWTELRTVGVVEAQRTVKGKTTSEMRYYIGSFESDAKVFANAVRGHWSVENNLHWVLDIAFREDESRVRIGNAAANLGILRHIALNALKKEQTLKRGIKGKRLKAGWDESYLAKVLLGL
jgi:predicted transposase YbfD/YdcC